MINKDLFKLIGKQKKYIFLSTFLMFLGLLGNIGFIVGICWFIDLVIKGREIYAFLYPVILLSTTIVFRFGLTVINGRVKSTLGNSVKQNLRERIYLKLLKLSLKGKGELGLSGFTQVALEGIEQLDLYYSVYLPQFFYSMIAPIFLFLITVMIDYRTALVLILAVPLIPISIVVVSKWAKRIFSKYWNKYLSMGNKFLDYIMGFKELAVFNYFDEANIDINEKAEAFRKITMKVLVMQLASITIMDLVAFGGAGVGVAFAIKYLNQNGGYGILSQLSSPVHVVIPVLFMILVAVEFFLPLRTLGSSFHVAMNGISAGKKIVELFKEPESSWGNEKITDLNVKLNDVSFGYNDNYVLKNVNMTFKNHSLTAIVGESGSGKSTIANLILRMFEPSEGTITIGDHALKDYARKNFYQNLGIVSYNTFIFNTTIRENFCFAKNNATDEEITSALHLVKLDHFTPDDLIKENATNISGGERQRLALAINLLADKNIYILDEATSNIDRESEEIIISIINEIKKTKNIILISHRLENVVKADYIYLLKEKSVFEEGTHEELLKRDGLYKRIYNTQKNLELGKPFEVKL